MLEQKFYINCKLKFSFVVLDQKKFIVINSNFKKVYFFIPLQIKVKKCIDNLTFIYSVDSKKSSDILCNNFKKWLQLKEKPSIKKLILKGLGLKVTLTHSNVLEFKLGFSHLIKLTISKSISIVLVKNIIILESFNLVELGNVANKIKRLKKPNSYKGKGIWYKNEKLNLKLVKKA